MRLLHSPKVPVFAVQTSLAQCRSAQMIEVMLCYALEDSRYSAEEQAQMEEVGELQKAALRC